MKFIPPTVLLLIVIGFYYWIYTSDSAHGFCTVAEYDAPEMNFRLKIVGAGEIETGADLSFDTNAIALICPSANTSKSFRLKRTAELAGEYAITDGETGLLEWDSQRDQTVLETVFQAAGYERLSDNEIAETMRVFKGISYGPKGTTMPGQSDIFKVISVNFKTEQCQAHSASKWLEESEKMLSCAQ